MSCSLYIASKEYLQPMIFFLQHSEGNRNVILEMKQSTKEQQTAHVPTPVIHKKVFIIYEKLTEALQLNCIILETAEEIPLLCPALRYTSRTQSIQDEFSKRE